MNSIKKLTLTLIITSMLLLITIPSFATTGTITVDTLRARKTPSTSSDVLRNLDSGDKIEIIEKSGDWYKIKLSDGSEAYVYAEYVKLDENATTNENSDQKETTEKTEIQLEKNTQIYILPLLFSNEIGKISESTTVKVVEVINNWVCVEYNGITGWVLNKQNKNTVTTTQTGTTSTSTENKTGYINATSAFLRKEPSKTAEIIESLYLNNEVKILKEVDGWYQVQLGSTTGYIFAELISDKQTGTTSRSLSTPRTSTTSEVISIQKTAYINATTLNVRDTASSTGKVVTTLKLKAQVEITGEINGWYKILTTSGEGYISKQYVVDSLDKVVVKTTPAKSSSVSATGVASGKAGSVIEYARQYLGCQYVYAGSGPTTFDCSGFTMYVFKHFGISLPHNASTQSNYGQYVSKANLQPGDLVIFNNYANTSIGHVGIYLGGGQFIHAANSREDVTTDTLNSGYYNTRFVEGRRLV